METEQQSQQPVITDEFEKRLLEEEKQFAEESSPTPAQKAEGDEEEKPAETPAEETPKQPEGEKPKEEESKPKEDKPIEEDGKPKSKFAKEKERQKTQWDLINEQKAVNQKHADALKAREQAIAERERSIQLQIEEAKRAQQKPKFTKSQYLEHAKNLRTQASKLEDEGNFDDAAEKTALAKLAEKAASEAPETVPVDDGKPDAQIIEAQRNSWNTVVEEIPEVGQKGTALNQFFLQEVNRIAKEQPELAKLPNFPRLLAHYCQGQLAIQATKLLHDKLQESEKQSETLKKRVKELEAATSPSGGSRLGGRLGVGSFEELSEEEEERQLRADLSRS